MNVNNPEHGYIVSKLENIAEDLQELKEELKFVKESHDELKTEVANFKIRGDATVRVFKWIIAFFAAILTLKLGDIKSLWISLFGK